jgi:hypothetical protein
LCLLDTAKAAVEAGYSPNGAAQTAYKLLKHPVVQREIEKLRARHERRPDRKLDHVLDELDKLAFSNMADYPGLLGAEDPVAHPRTMGPEEGAAIDGLTIDERMAENGKTRGLFAAGSLSVWRIPCPSGWIRWASWLELTLGSRNVRRS